MILCGGSDFGELKSPEHDFKYLYWPISKMLLSNRFTCNGTYITDCIGRILFDDCNFGNASLYCGFVELGDVRVPVEWVPIACKNNDFRLDPDEAAFNSALERVAICKFLVDVKNRDSIKAHVIKDQNIGEFSSVEPFSGVV